MKKLHFVSLAASFVLATSAAAQNGTDSCSAPTPIGPGIITFNTSTMVGSADLSEGACGTLPFNQDMFWLYTVTSPGDLLVDLSGSMFDTTLAIYSGTNCSATCIGEDDDSGAFGTSRMELFGVSAGDRFVIQVGGFGSGAGAGTMLIQEGILPCSPSLDDMFEDNDDCANAYPMTDGVTLGLFASEVDNDFYSFCVTAGSTLDTSILFTQTSGDLDLFLREASSPVCDNGFQGGDLLAFGWSVSDNEYISWTNFSGADMDVVLHVSVFGGGCNIYDLAISGTGGCGPELVGTPFCDPMNVNSTGQSTTLTGTLFTGIGPGTGSGLNLQVANGPVGRLGYMLVGTGSSEPGITIGQGSFCLAPGPANLFGRYNVSGTDMNSVGVFDASGVLLNVVGTAASSGGFGFDVPIALPNIGGTIMVGDTFHFQLWHRDAGGTTNFSNGLSVTF